MRLFRVMLAGMLVLAFVLISACSNNHKSGPESVPGDNGLPAAQTYDLIVVGGEPEGVAAAVSAARNGLNVLLLEEGQALGGLFTLGRLNFLDMNYGPGKELLTRGIFEEFYKSQGNAFDIEEAKRYFLDLVQKEKSIALRLDAVFLEPLLEENRIIGVKVQEKGAIREYYGLRVIDATADADVVAASGVPYTVGAEDYGYPDKQMGVTLVFAVKGVNWPYVFLYNNWQRLISKLKPGWGDPYAGAGWKTAWGYGEQALEYQPQDKLMRFRGPNLARQKGGSVLINALLIFGVDALDPESRALGIERGKKELPHILEFMREKFPGFARVELVDTAKRLYVRETRHIEGEYRLTITDVLENRDQWDRIAHGSYPVDIQPAGPDDLGNVIGNPAIYSIPFGSLVPLKIDNLLVVGRGASYDSLPHGSARVVPIGMAVGEAAGVAAAYSVENDLGFREMSKSREAVEQIQERLKKQGAYLVEYDPPQPAVMDHWAYPGVRVMRELGLAAGGYGNNYRLEEPIKYWDANYMLAEVLKQAHRFNNTVVVREIQFPENLTRADLLSGLCEALTGEKTSPEKSAALLRQKGVLMPETEDRMQDMQAAPTFGELYTLLARVYEVLMK